MVDLADIVGAKRTDEEKVRLRILLRPGQEPHIVEAPASTTIAELEQRLARKLALNPENVRLHYASQPLSRSKTVAEVRALVGEEGVLEILAVHKFAKDKGAESPPIFFVDEGEAEDLKAPELNKVIIPSETFGEMLLLFADAALRGEEAMGVLSGKAENGVTVLREFRVPKLSHVSGASVEPDSGWLIQWMNEICKMGHNVIVEAHRHPIGSSMSAADRSSLSIISRWLNPAGIRAMICCCDIELAVYQEDNEGKARKVGVEILWPERPVSAKPGEAVLIPAGNVRPARGLLARLGRLGSLLKRRKGGESAEH